MDVNNANQQNNSEIQSTSESVSIARQTNPIYDNIASKKGIDIENEKKEFTANISDVNANTILLFQNSTIKGGVSFGDNNFHEVTESNSNIEKSYDLSDAIQFSELGKKYKGGEYFAAAVILCVFEYIKLSDFQRLKAILLRSFPSSIDEEGKEIVNHEDPYLSINTILEKIGGKSFASDHDGTCIGLGDKQKKALKNLWEQFPSLRDCIAHWMISVCDTSKIQTKFDIIQMCSAFINIFKLDFDSSIMHFFPRFTSNPNNHWLLGYIANELYNDLSYREKIAPYINQWAESYKTWLWKVSLYVYINIKEDDENQILIKKVKYCLMRQLCMINLQDTYNKNLSYIISMAIGSKRLRSLLSSILNELIYNTKNNKNKLHICMCFIELVRYGYYSVSTYHVALPLIACDNKQQLEEIFPIVNMIMNQYKIKKLLLMILELYLKEISKYVLSQKVINSLKAFFKLLADNNPRYHDDIILFLQKCDCEISKEIKLFIQTLSIDEKTQNNLYFNIQ